MPNGHMFVPDMRVSAARKLRPCRDGQEIKRFTAGTVVFADHRWVFVQFDALDHEIRVKPGDILPITLDELRNLKEDQWENLRVGGGTYAN